MVRDNNASRVNIGYATLSVKDILNLSCLLQALSAKSLAEIGPYDEETDDPDLLDRIEELFHAGLIQLSEKSSVDTFSDFKSGDRSVQFRLDLAKWHVWVTDDRLSEQQLFDLLKNPHPGLEFHPDEVVGQYQELALTVMADVFENYIYEYHFRIKTKKEADLVNESLNRWLVTYTPGQIYNLMWRSTRQAYADIGANKAGNYRYHPINFIIKIMDQKAAQLARNPKEFESYSYPSNVLPEPLKAQIFFGEMLIQPDWFLNRGPQLNVESNLASLVSDNQLSEMVDLEWNDQTEIPKIVEKAEYYDVTDFGIVVGDMMGETLYSNQIAIYGAFKSDDLNAEDATWLEHAESVFMIKHFYDLAYLMTLLSKLKQANVVQRKSDGTD
ncbi:MAG TPA: hypothetical protein DCW31_10045 [Lactobacillus sp.]|nr:hypothetical protein [Lactobacillus sp.]